jgi:hypothetical protein
VADITYPISVQQLNAELKARLRNLVGDELVKVKRVGDAATLSLNIDGLLAVIGRTAVTARVTGGSTGSGIYTGRLQIPTGKAVDPSTDISTQMSSLWQDRTSSDDCIIINDAEISGSSGSHQLATDGSAYVEGRLVPIPTARGGLPMVVQCNPGSPGSLPPGTGKYKVLQLIDDKNPGTPGWDWVRGH